MMMICILYFEDCGHIADSEENNAEEESDGEGSAHEGEAEDEEEWVAPDDVKIDGINYGVRRILLGLYC